MRVLNVPELSSAWVLPRFLVDLQNPEDWRLEPEDTPLEEENHLRNHHDFRFYVNLRGVLVRWYGCMSGESTLAKEETSEILRWQRQYDTVDKLTNASSFPWHSMQFMSMICWPNWDTSLPMSKPLRAAGNFPTWSTYRCLVSWQESWWTFDKHQLQAAFPS